MYSKAVIDIKQIVHPERFQKIQDDIAAATGLAIITVDYKGIPITVHSNCSDFCRKMRSSDTFRNYCEKCDSRGGLEAARLQKPFIYVCHAGLIDLAIPIIVNSLYLGAFMAGQVLIENQEDLNKLERILTVVGVSADFSQNHALGDDYSRLQIMNLERIEALSKMLQHIGNYCVQEAVLKANKDQLNPEKPHSYQAAERYSENRHTGIVLSSPRVRAPNTILQPAFEHIKQHSDERITLSKMAALCNVSPSYFSKLFSKENLGSLSNYVNSVKISQAKELLLSTDWSVRYIADKFGFDDCSYFIKVFKKEVGTTPEEFRMDSSFVSD
jgi:ligand-binding sensor protein/AraC-like DNA-binding protein